MKKVFVFLAEGFEESEAVLPIDILRRAGISVQTVSVTGNRIVTGAHQIPVQADLLFEEGNFSEGEMLVLPGGMPGTRNLQAHEGLAKLIFRYAEKGRYLAAICAAPLVYGQLGLLEGKKAICYPGFENELKDAVIIHDKVVRDGHFITSAGPGTAMQFGLTLAAILAGDEVAENVAKGMLVK